MSASLFQISLEEARLAVVWIFEIEVCFVNHGIWDQISQNFFRARRARAALPECRAPFPARSQPRCARTPGTSSRSAVNTRVALHNIQHAGASEDRHRSVSAPRTHGAHQVLRRQDVPSLTRAGRRWRCATSAQHALRLRCAAGRAGPISPRAFTPFRPSSCSSGAQGHRSGTSDAAVSTSWGSRIAQRRS